jgi:hypothetical protein
MSIFTFTSFRIAASMVEVQEDEDKLIFRPHYPWTRTDQYLVLTGTGTLFGALGYGFYTTVQGQVMNNVRAMGYRVGAQFAIVAAGLGYFAVTEYGTPSEIYARYQTTGKWFSNGSNVQEQLSRHTKKHDA